MATRLNDNDLARYEGLVFKTSQMYEYLLGYEREDLQQVLRMRVVIAVKAYDPRRSAISEKAFVFGAIRNQIKDLVKAKVRRDKHGSQVYIEDFKHDDSENFVGSFEQDHLSIEVHEHNDVVLPKSITAEEREVIALLYVGYRQTEIAALMECQRRDIERRVRVIRRKLADWRPSASGDAEIIELESRVRRVLQQAAA